jgi:hypothetical protein
MTGQYYSLSVSEVRPGDDGVAVPVHSQVPERGQGIRDSVGQRSLIATDGFGIDEPGGQFGRRLGKIKFHDGSLASRHRGRRQSAARRAPAGQPAAGGRARRAPARNGV